MQDHVVIEGHDELGGGGVVLNCRDLHFGGLLDKNGGEAEKTVVVAGQTVGEVAVKFTREGVSFGSRDGVIFAKGCEGFLGKCFKLYGFHRKISFVFIDKKSIT